MGFLGFRVLGFFRGFRVLGSGAGFAVVAGPELEGHATKDGRVCFRAHPPLEDLPNVTVQGRGR